MTGRRETAGKAVMSGLEYLLLGLLWVYLVSLTLATTTFFLPVPEDFSVKLLTAAAAAAAVRLIVLSVQERSPKPLAGLAVSLLCFRIWQGDGYEFLLFLAVFIPGLTGIGCRRILRVHVTAVGTVVLLAAAACFSGAITNYVYFRDGFIRSACGICYPTDFAAYLVYLFLGIWILLRRVPETAFLPAACAVLWIAAFIARSNTSAITAAGILLVLVLRILEERGFFERKYLSGLHRWTDRLLTAGFPLFAVAFFCLMAAFSRNIPAAVTIDRLITGRLGLACVSMEEYGVTLFGTPFEQVGFGFTTFESNDYNFVDSSYPLILIRYGWTALAAAGAFWCLGTRKALKTGERRMAYAMFLIALHSFSEHHFPELHYNFFLLFPFALWTLPAAAQAAEERTAGMPAEAGRQTVREGQILLSGAGELRYLAAYVPAAFLAVFGAPGLFTMLRTFFNRCGLTGGGDAAAEVIVILLAVLAVIASLAAAVIRMIRGYRSSGKISLPAAGAAVFCLVLTALFLAGSRRGTETKRVEMKEQISREREALELVTASGERVYVEDLPEVYRLEFGNVDDSLFPGEDLARFRDVSVVMKADRDSDCFLRRGFLYTGISDEHCIYTNDPSVIKALSDHGYHMTAYYAAERDADLADLAERNALELDGRGALILYGPKHDLLYGPYLDLYAGDYTVTMELETDDPGAFSWDEFGEAVVSAYWGQEVYDGVKLSAADFDGNGRQQVRIPFSAENNCRGVEFIIHQYQDVPVRVSRIFYQSTPEYDVHFQLNAAGKRVREEYYDAEGAPARTEQGFFAREFGYDADGNVDLLSYFDGQGRPVLIKNGYAVCRREYNNRRQITRQTYYDTEDRPVMLPAGYAEEVREYSPDGTLLTRSYYDTAGQLVKTVKE